MSIDDYDGQMIFGDLGGLKLPKFVLQVRKNHEKTSPRKLVPTGDRTRARCVTSAHATTSSTAVDNYSWDTIICTQITALHLCKRTKFSTTSIKPSCVKPFKDPWQGNGEPVRYLSHNKRVFYLLYKPSKFVYRIFLHSVYIVTISDQSDNWFESY